jgi:tripartite-type tricarboxylate transporter receptor subunit TctC/transcriptional regulator with XRE-family HTH domain
MAEHVNPVGRQIGTRVRMRRIMLDLTRTQVAEALCVTFRQVQKYEKGETRISAGRLKRFCALLHVPVGFFFEGAPQALGFPGAAESEAGIPDCVSEFLAVLSGMNLAERSCASVMQGSARRSSRWSDSSRHRPNRNSMGNRLSATGSYGQLRLTQSCGRVVGRSSFRQPYLAAFSFAPLPAPLPAALLTWLLASLVVCGPVQSQTPKAIKIVVPFPPGGGSDLLGRILADQIHRAERITAVVENRAGAGSVIGTDAVSHAAPDGTTLLINTPNIVIAAHLRKLSYDPLTSFEPICKLGSSPALVVVNDSSPYRTLADLVAAARGRPGLLTLASVGPATTLHVAAEKLKRASGADMIYVPFPGSGPAVSAVLGGHVTAALAEYPAVSAQIDGGELRALGTGEASRNGLLANLPTIAEAGYPGFEIDLWWGLFAPAHTPRDVVSRLADMFERAVETSEVRGKLAGIGFFPAVRCGDLFASYLHQQYSEYGEVIDEARNPGQ